MFNEHGVAAPRLHNRKRRILAVLSVCLFLAGTVFAVQSTPLPDFSVQTLGGSPFRSSDWPLQGKWLVIYVEGRCGTCAGLLGRLNAREYPQLAARTIIIVGDTPLQDAQALQNKFPDLAAAGWYADPPRNASVAFNLHGAPVIIGVQDRVVHWQISGIPADRDVLHSVLTGWLRQ
jgi:hypothetical protein